MTRNPNINAEILAFLENENGVTAVSCKKFLSREFNIALQAIPLFVYNIEQTNITNFKEKVEDLYGKNIEFTAIFEHFKRENFTLNNDFNGVLAVIIKDVKIGDSSKYSFSTLLEILKRLRDPNGCPWDKEQTHSSIRGCLLEESYELIEAIDINCREKMLEECGDVLLQALFHAAISEDLKEFTLNDVIDSLSKKLFSRHTHIFGENKAKDSVDALKFWDEAKSKEQKTNKTFDKIDKIPVTFSALLTAEKVQKIIKKTGFDYVSIKDAYNHLQSEIEELRLAEGENIENECGDVLFSAVNVIRMLGVNPEIALNKTTEKFKKRFKYVEDSAEKLGVSLKDCSLNQMEEWYQEYKKKYENR